jgi:hypothetical protein
MWPLNLGPSVTAKRTDGGILINIDATKRGVLECKVLKKENWQAYAKTSHRNLCSKLNLFKHFLQNLILSDASKDCKNYATCLAN